MIEAPLSAPLAHPTPLSLTPQINCRNATVTVVINGTEILGIIDSAAQVTVMDTQCWKDVMHCEPIGEAIYLRQADGKSTLRATLVSSVKIDMGTYSTTMPIHVTPIADTMLLGLDFLLSANAIIDLAENNLVINNCHIPQRSNYWNS